MLASRFLHLSGGTDADLCAVATPARGWAAGSPQAVNRAPLDADGYYASRMIARPLRVLDCARPVNGAVAVIVSSARAAARAANATARPAIEILGMGAAHPMRRRRAGGESWFDLVAGDMHGEPLAERDLLTYCKFLLVAGTETTRNLISSGIALLSEHPDQRALLIDEPALLPNAVEEMLRVTSPVLAFCRTALVGTEIRGQQITAGDYVAMLYASANRDEEIWPDPDRFDVLRRQERPHVAFGFGPHVCLGASLARMEARVLFGELLRTFPDFQVTGPAVRGRSTLVAMVSELPAAFGSRAPARAGV